MDDPWRLQELGGIKRGVWLSGTRTKDRHEESEAAAVGDFLQAGVCVAHECLPNGLPEHV